jgi:hypothetical protein
MLLKLIIFKRIKSKPTQSCLKRKWMIEKLKFLKTLKCLSSVTIFQVEAALQWKHKHKQFLPCKLIKQILNQGSEILLLTISAIRSLVKKHD